MQQRIFVNVIGLSDVERHALNTVFRLSEEGLTAYAPWNADAPEAARLLLIDGAASNAMAELERPGNAALPLVWIGPDAPQRAWRSFERPLSWPAVVRSMDTLFPPPVELDFDLDLAVEVEPELDFDLDNPDSLATRPPDSVLPAPKRALIAAASLEERLYLRARLSLAGLTAADEAATAAQALELAAGTHYAVVVLDFGLPDLDGWSLAQGLRQLQPPIPWLIAIKARPSLAERIKALLGRVDGLLAKPPHPRRLQDLLQKV